MAGNVSDAILRLELEVIGLDTTKAAAATYENLRAAASKPIRGEVTTVISAIDATTPILQKISLAYKELKGVVENAIGGILTAHRAYRAELRSMTPAERVGARPGIAYGIAQRYGLYGPDVERVEAARRLYATAAVTQSLLNRAGQTEADQQALRNIRRLGRANPPGGQLPLLAALGTFRGGITEESAGQVQGLLAEVAPALATGRMVAQLVSALRLIASTTPYLGMRGVRSLAPLRRLAPGPVGQLLALGQGGMFTEAATDPLVQLALALSTEPRMIIPGRGAAPIMSSWAAVAQRQRFRTFGPTARETPQQQLLRSQITGQYFAAMPLQLTAGERTEAGYIRQITTSRPKIEDIKAVGAGIYTAGGELIRPRQAIPFVEPIETTARVVSPQVRKAIEEVENVRINEMKRLATLQGRGMAGQQFGLNWWQNLGQGMGFPEAPSIWQRMWQPLRNVFMSESGMARVGPSSNISMRQAINYLRNFEGESIYPGVLFRELGINKEVGASLIGRLQQRGYLGLPGSVPGLAASALPIIGDVQRRSKQLETALAAETEATEGSTRAERVRARAAQRLAQRLEAAGGGPPGAGGPPGPGGMPPGEEEPPGGGGGGRPGLALGGFGRRFRGLAYFIGSAAILYPLASTIFQTIGAAAELQTNIARIQAIYGTSSLSDQLTIRQEILDASKQLGENVNQVAKSAELFARSGTSIKNLGTDMQAAATAAKAWGTVMESISNYIIAIRESSQGRVGPQQAVDILSLIRRRTNVPIPALMQGMENILPVLQPFPAGAVPNEALIPAIIGRVGLTAGISGTQVAAALRFATSQIANQSTAEKLERIIGRGLGTAESQGRDLRPFVDILNDVAVAYERLIKEGNSAEAKALIRDFFGARQASAGTALLIEWNKSLSLAAEAMHSAGETAKQVSPVLETFGTKWEKIKTQLTGFWEPFIQTGMAAEDMVSGMLDLVGKLTATAGKVVLKIDPQIPDQILSLLSVIFPGFAAGRLMAQNRAETTATAGIVPAPVGHLTPQQVMNMKGGKAVFDKQGKLISGSLAQVLGLETVTPAPLDTGAAVDTFLKNADKIRDEVRAEVEMFTMLGQSQNYAKAELAAYTRGVKEYLSLTEAQQRQAKAAAAGRRVITGFVTAYDLVGEQEMLKQQAREVAQIMAVETAGAKSLEAIQLRFLQSRRQMQGRSADQNIEFQLIDAQTALAKLNLQAEYQAKVAAETDLNKEKLLIEEYGTQLQILDIKNQQAKTDMQMNDILKQRLEFEQQSQRNSESFIRSLIGGLEKLPEAISKNRALGRFQRLSVAGLLAENVLGPVASTLAGNRMADIQQAVSKGNVLPGIKRFLSGTGKIDDQIRARQQDIQDAINAQAPPDYIQHLKDSLQDLQNAKTKQQLKVGAAEFGGQLITAATGGNLQNSQIGGEIGSLAGEALFGPIGAIVGGGLGSLVGGLFGRHHRPPPAVGHLQIIAENTREQVKLLENTNKLLQANFVSFNVPTGFRLPAYVPGSFGGIGGLRGASGGVVNSQIAVNVNIGGTNVAADKLGQTIAQAISDRLELESRTSGGYFPRMLYG